MNRDSEIVRRYVAGETITELATVFGLSYARTYAIIRKAVPIVPRRGVRRYKRRYSPPAFQQLSFSEKDLNGLSPTTRFALGKLINETWPVRRRDET